MIYAGLHGFPIEFHDIETITLINVSPIADISLQL